MIKINLTTYEVELLRPNLTKDILNKRVILDTDNSGYIIGRITKVNVDEHDKVDSIFVSGNRWYKSWGKYKSQKVINWVGNSNLNENCIGGNFLSGKAYFIKKIKMKWYPGV